MRGSFIQAEATHALLTFYIMAEVCRIDLHPAFTKSFTPTFRSKFLVCHKCRCQRLWLKADWQTSLGPTRDFNEHPFHSVCFCGATSPTGCCKPSICWLDGSEMGERSCMFWGEWLICRAQVGFGCTGQTVT